MVRTYELLGEQLALFPKTKLSSGAKVSRGHIQVVWVWIPLVKVSKENRLCSITPEPYQHIDRPVEYHIAKPGKTAI